MLTPLGRLLVLGTIVIALIALTAYLFVFSQHGPDFICEHRVGCVVRPR